MSKKILIVKAVFSSLFIILATNIVFAQTDSKIVILKSAKIEQYEMAVKGFYKDMKLEKRGIEFVMSSGSVNDAELLSEITKENPNLILAVGSDAASFCLRNIKDKPVVFCMVLDPHSQGLVSVPNITGVSLDIPLIEYVKLIEEIIPGAQKIGMIFDPEQNNNNAQQIKQLLQDKGLTAEFKEVKSSEEIANAFLNMAATIDALWVIADNTVCNSYSIEYLLVNTVKRGVPLIGISRQYVKAGALFALVADYNDIGRQSAEIAQNILQGTPLSSIQISNPRKFGLILNMRTAELINLKIPSYLVNKAEEVFK